MTIKGKSAVVTGSTSGIGLGIATALAEAGVHLMLNGFGDPNEIEKIRAELAATHGVKVEYSPADMSKPAEIHGMIEAALAKLGGIDILVNNAGIQFTADTQDFPDEKWDSIIAINLSAAFHAIKAALPYMQKKGWGRIVNIASAHGLVASAQKVAYVTAKHGLLGMTKVVALENANKGITCVALCPGWVLTPLVEKQIEDRAAKTGTSVEAQKVALLSEKQPMHEFSTPEQFGAFVVFLAGEAGRTVTGTAISVDGGWTAQ